MLFTTSLRLIAINGPGRLALRRRLARALPVLLLVAGGALLPCLLAVHEKVSAIRADALRRHRTSRADVRSGVSGRCLWLAVLGALFFGTYHSFGRHY